MSLHVETTAGRASAPATGSLLVVDDNEMNRDMLSRRLARRGYDVTLAEDGAQALELLAGGPFDLVLLDVMMPGVDGLSVLEQARRSRTASELPVIMATAKDRSEDVVRALELGANDYVTKPLDFPVVLARVETQLALKRAHQALAAAHRRMKRDLEAAARVQRALIPRVAPEVDGIRFAWMFEPCDELAGDILDLVPLDREAIGLYLLDVSGHGVPAALLAVTLSRLLSHVAEDSPLLRPGDGDAGKARGARPAEVVSRLNRRFPMDPGTNQYFTIFYAVLDPRSRRLDYVCAGHPGPLLMRRDSENRVLDAGGPPVGWLPDLEYEEGSVTLTAGDRLYFFSDGVTEARAAAGEMFGLERLTRVLEEGRGVGLEESLARLADRLREWCPQGRFDDDVTLLALEVE